MNQLIISFIVLSFFVLSGCGGSSSGGGSSNSSQIDSKPPASINQNPLDSIPQEVFAKRVERANYYDQQGALEYHYLFSYNSQGLLESIKEYYLNGGNYVIEGAYFIEYNGTLITKLYSCDDCENPETTDTNPILLNYDANGSLISAVRNVVGEELYSFSDDMVTIKNEKGITISEVLFNNLLPTKAEFYFENGDFDESSEISYDENNKVSKVIFTDSGFGVDTYTFEYEANLISITKKFVDEKTQAEEIYRIEAEYEDAICTYPDVTFSSLRFYLLGSGSFPVCKWFFI